MLDVLCSFSVALNHTWLPRKGKVLQEYSVTTARWACRGKGRARYPHQCLPLMSLDGCHCSPEKWRRKEWRSICFLWTHKGKFLVCWPKKKLKKEKAASHTFPKECHTDTEWDPRARLSCVIATHCTPGTGFTVPLVTSEQHKCCTLHWEVSPRSEVR